MYLYLVITIEIDKKVWNLDEMECNFAGLISFHKDYLNKTCEYCHKHSKNTLLFFAFSNIQKNRNK